MYPMFPNQPMFNPMLLNYPPMPMPQMINPLFFMNQQQQMREQAQREMLTLMQLRMQNQQPMVAKLPVFEPLHMMDDLLSVKTNCSLATHDSTPELLKKLPIKHELIQNEFKPMKQPVVVKKEAGAAKSNKGDVYLMVHFLLDNIGKLSKSELDEAKKKYCKNEQFCTVWDTIVEKYISVKKHREDIVRYIIRRAFKYLKTNTIKKQKVFGKRAYAVLCKRYFQDHIDELEKSGINIEDEKELIEFILPYRKNSKNRTMNVNFTAEIFSSKAFCEDYKIFLDHFETILNNDNSSKVAKLVHMAEEAIRKGNADKIKNCTRLPWIKLWVEKTTKMAGELVHSGFTIEDDQHKKIKTEGDSSEHSLTFNRAIKQEADSQSSGDSC